MRQRKNAVSGWKKQQPFSLAAAKFIEHAKCIGKTECSYWMRFMESSSYRISWII